MNMFSEDTMSRQMSYEDSQDLDTVIFRVSSCEDSFVETELQVEKWIEETVARETSVRRPSMQWLKEDETGRTFYAEQCRISGVVPCGQYMRNPDMESVALAHYGLGAAGSGALASSLVYSHSLIELDLTDNWLGDEAVPALTRLVRLNESLTRLVLVHNRLGPDCAQLLCETLANSAILTSLDLSHNLFDDKAAIHFGELMILALRLEHLNLSYNRFGSECLIPFGHAFLQTTSILRLDLSFNNLGGIPTKVAKFTNGLAKNRCIQLLNLRSNSFSSKEAMQSFGKMLKLNTTLLELDLTNNRINTESVVRFAKMLPASKTIHTLRLGRNAILSAGCYAIVNFCLRNPDPPFRILDFESIEVNQDFCVLAEKLLIQIPDILILTGVRMIEKVVSDVDPVYRCKLLAVKNEMSILNFFKRFVKTEEDLFVDLDEVPNIIDEFCKEYRFQLLKGDRQRLYKVFPRNDERIVDFKTIASVFNEEYQDVVEAEPELVLTASAEKDEDPPMKLGI